MRKISLFIGAWLVCIGIADAAVRDTSGKSRTQSDITVRSAGTSRTSAKTTQTIQNRTGATTSRAATSVKPRATTARTSQNNIARAARTARATTTRSATAHRTPITARASNTTARATTIAASTVTNTFGTGYNACRDAYFTCMDQFCATQNDTYRRCVCSSRLDDIKSRERALAQGATQIQDFKDLNIDVIPKTPAEVNAMLSASAGEYAAEITTNRSESAAALHGISAVLTNTKSKSLSTAGTLDIAGDINSIWATTELASGVNISNLTGEALYNAVHAQCADLISGNCESSATLDMVVSAYGMYIENDCVTLLNSLDKKLTAANSTIRETEREMNVARLENYNAHNSTSINDCIANVRTDITADTACGTDYVHCLDITGKYLKYATGEPIYTSDFYQLASATSLSGDVLTNPANRLIISELNKKRVFAESSLDTCRDLADDVWTEFLRQAIAEIYQGQQERIRQVRTECVDIVSACYDEQNQSLKDFSNIKEQLLAGQRLELSEEMCREKLDTCSNLYANGAEGGLELLLTTMHNITDQKIAQGCHTALKEYAADLCAVPSNDSLHSYPYGCRTYTPSEQRFATIALCNQSLQQLQSSTDADTQQQTNTGTTRDATERLPEICEPESPRPYLSQTEAFVCDFESAYYSCTGGHYLATCEATSATQDGQPVYRWKFNKKPTAYNRCRSCSDDGYMHCPGGASAPVPYMMTRDQEESTCGDYIGSLYQKLVRYAAQVCVRPSEAIDDTSAYTYTLPTSILQDVNSVMDSIRINMATELATECERLGGRWVSTPWIDIKSITPGATGETTDGIHDTTGDTQFKFFYDETGANPNWGYCANPESTSAESKCTTYELAVNNAVSGYKDDTGTCIPTQCQDNYQFDSAGKCVKKAE